MIPCNKSNVNAVKCTLENIPNTKVCIIIFIDYLEI